MLDDEKVILTVKELKAYVAEAAAELIREKEAKEKEKEADPEFTEAERRKRKAEILAISDTPKRLKAIRENMDLFK